MDVWPFDSHFRLYLLALVVFTLGNSSDAFLRSERVNSVFRPFCCRSCGVAFTCSRAVETCLPALGGERDRPEADDP